MTDVARNALLIIVIVLIVAAIWYLESRKAPVLGSAEEAHDAIDLATTSSAAAPHTPDFAQRLAQYPAAKELVSPDGYINTNGEPITIKSLIGKKVILLDFWTYSCINCQRTIPYLNAWYAKYKDAGLEIIGAHAPEFEFEKKLKNVQDAVAKFGIKYPVVLDSEMNTWNSYGNQYWPEHYLIDINGLVVDRHIGEGGYAETEAKIQQLLAERKEALRSATEIPTGTVDITQTVATQSPETYFGAARNAYLANGVQVSAGVQTLKRPADGSIRSNQLYLAGTWDFKDQYAESKTAGARIIYKYIAKNVYFVASAVGGAQITVLRDGVPVAAQRGEDVDASGHVMVKEARLYKLISEKDMGLPAGQAGAHTLEIIVKDTGLDAYTFTFG